MTATSHTYFPRCERCAICGINRPTVLEKHHVSYDPEKIIILCANCHVRLKRDAEFRRRLNNLLMIKCHPKNLIERLKEEIYLDRKRKSVSIKKILEIKEKMSDYLWRF